MVCSFILCVCPSSFPAPFTEGAVSIPLYALVPCVRLAMRVWAGSGLSAVSRRSVACSVYSGHVLCKSHVFSPALPVRVLTVALQVERCLLLRRPGEAWLPVLFVVSLAWRLLPTPVAGKLPRRHGGSTVPALLSGLCSAHRMPPGMESPAWADSRPHSTPGPPCCRPPRPQPLPLSPSPSLDCKTTV